MGGWRLEGRDRERERREEGRGRGEGEERGVENTPSWLGELVLLMY